MHTFSVISGFLEEPTCTGNTVKMMLEQLALPFDSSVPQA